MEYEGSASGPVNGAVVDGAGNASLGATIGGTIGQLAADGWNIINGVFGIPAAQASNYSIMVGPTQIGFTILPGVGGLTLSQMLETRAARIDHQGTILDPAGRFGGKVDLGVPGMATIGPLNADINTETVQTVVSQNGNGVFESARVPISLGRVLRSIDGHAITPTQRFWTPTTCSTAGVPVLDQANTMNLFATPPAMAKLSPRFVGGRDGIYDLCSGLRVVPPASVGPAPQGFGLGTHASYARTTLGIGWTSNPNGGVYLWGIHGTPADAWGVFDPTTNAYPVLAAYFQVAVWDGSQQISTVGYSYDYPTGPSAADPRFNSSVAGKIATTGAWTNSAFRAPITGQNNGGPDGGPA